jgi:hypothetical protein
MPPIIPEPARRTSASNSSKRVGAGCEDVLLMRLSGSPPQGGQIDELYGRVRGLEKNLYADGIQGGIRGQRNQGLRSSTVNRSSAVNLLLA